MVNILSHDLTEEGDPGYNQSVGGWSPGAASVGYQGGLYTGPGTSLTQQLNAAIVYRANAISQITNWSSSVGLAANFAFDVNIESGVTTDIGYGAPFDVPAVTFNDDPYGAVNSGGTSGDATIAPAATVPIGVQPGNPNLQPAPNNVASDQSNFTRVGTVVDRTEIGEVNPGGGRFLQWTDATKTVDSLGLYGQVTTLRAIGLYGAYTTYKVQWSGFYRDPVSGAVQIRPEAEFFERTLTGTTTRATMEKTYSHFLATHAEANLNFAIRPEHQVGYTTIHGFRRLDDND